MDKDPTTLGLAAAGMHPTSLEANCVAGWNR
jgi:hypothetical protein